MIATLTKRRRYGQFGSTPSIGARWLPGFGAVAETVATPAFVFDASTRPIRFDPIRPTRIDASRPTRIDAPHRP